MTRFNNVLYHPETHTVDVPAGVIWDEVYAALDPYNVNVVGGRVPGIGAAGLTFGGGKQGMLNSGHRYTSKETLQSKGILG